MNRPENDDIDDRNKWVHRDIYTQIKDLNWFERYAAEKIMLSKSAAFNSGQSFFCILCCLLKAICQQCMNYRTQANEFWPNHVRPAGFLALLVWFLENEMVHHVPPLVLVSPSHSDSFLEPIRVEGRGPCRGSGEAIRTTMGMEEGGGEEFAYWAVSWLVLDLSRTLTTILIVLLQFVFSQYLWGSETLHEEVDQRLTQM